MHSLKNKIGDNFFTTTSKALITRQPLDNTQQIDSMVNHTIFLLSKTGG